MAYLKKHFEKFILGGILVVAFGIMLLTAKTDSMVIDEKIHIPAGYLHVWEGDYTFNSEHPPLLNDLAGLFVKIAKPNLPAADLKTFEGSDQWEYGDQFFYQSGPKGAPFGGNNVDQIVFWARFPFIILTLGLIYLVFLWARALFGKTAGLVATALTAFSPNILAHGKLAATDIGVTFFFVLTAWLLRKYYYKSSWSNALLLGLVLGLTILAKFSGLVVVPIVILGLLFLIIIKKPKVFRTLGQYALILVLPIILMWLVYAFSMRAVLLNLPPYSDLVQTFNYQVVSSPIAQWLILPFNKFIQGLEILSDHNLGGHWAYLNGQVSSSGWWYYFPLVMWYKMTLVEMALFLIAFGGFLINKKLRVSWFDEFLVLFPPLLFLGVSMIGKIDIGIRHILPMLPFIFIFSSRVIQIKQPILKPIIWLLIIVEIIIGLLAYPNYLAYFNQIAGGNKGGLKHLADSNLDWNQNGKRFAEYAKKEGIQKVYELCWDGYSFTYRGIEESIIPSEVPYKPFKDVVVICSQQLVVTPDGFNISWVKNARPPDDNILGGIQIWRFDKNPLE